MFYVIEASDCHISSKDMVNIGSDNDLLPAWCHAIAITGADC